METDAKKKDESQPSRILATCRQSARRVCSLEFAKERFRLNCVFLIYVFLKYVFLKYVFLRSKFPRSVFVKVATPRLGSTWPNYFSNVYFSKVYFPNLKVCSSKIYLWRLPPLGWAPTYDLDMLTGDFVAGLTTALTVIPQGIGGTPFVRHCKFKIFCHGNDIYIFAGYAPLAGLPLQYGLYASIIPGFTYCLLGTTRQSLHT